MTVWFLESLARLKTERDAFANLECSTEWLTSTQWRLDNSGLVVDATLLVEGAEFKAQVVYPEQFPAVPPAVRPQNPTERWSSHQYGDGTLCLEWGPDTWHPSVTGAQLLESAHRLLCLEAPTGTRQGRPAPSRHQLTQGQELRFESLRYLLDDGLRERLGSVATGSCASALFTVHVRPKSLLAVIQSVKGSSGEIWANPAVPRPFALGEDSLRPFEALVVRLPEGDSVLSCPKKLEDLNAIIVRAGRSPLPSDGNQSAIIVEPDGSLHFYVRSFASTDVVCEYAPVRIDESATLGSRLPTTYATLGSKSVAIVGLGSLGSKVAEGLARVGVGRFHLTDDDLFLPANVVRNALDLSFVGDHKVDAVADLIARVSPHARTRVSRLNLTGQESNSALGSELVRLSECDLIIDATADPQVFNLLAHTARQRGVTMAWGEILAGGIGGVIARSRPGKDPGPHEMRRALAAFTQQYPAPDGAENQDYGMVDSTGRVLVASDADVSAIGALLTSLVIDSLLGTEPSRYPQSLYLIGLSRGWIFDAPFHVRPVDTPIQSEEPAAPTNLVGMEEEVDFLVSLMDKAKNESSSAK